MIKLVLSQPVFQKRRVFYIGEAYTRTRIQNCALCHNMIGYGVCIRDIDYCSFFHLNCFHNLLIDKGVKLLYEADLSTKTPYGDATNMNFYLRPE